MNGVVLDSSNSVARVKPVQTMPVLVASDTGTSTGGRPCGRTVLITSLAAMMIPAVPAAARCTYQVESGLTTCVCPAGRANSTELSHWALLEPHELPARLVLTKESADLVWSLLSNPPDPPQALIDLMNEP